MRNLIATIARVHPRGMPKPVFVDEMISWALTAPDEIFAPNDTKLEIFTRLKPMLGTKIENLESEEPKFVWNDLLHRKSALMEGMRVLSMFESNQRWSEGRDTTNSEEDSPDTISAGPFQISANSMALGEDLRDLANRHGIMRSVRDGEAFQNLMKTDHLFCFEYAFRLVRHTVGHHGPLRRTSGDCIWPYLSITSMQEFHSFLS